MHKKVLPEIPAVPGKESGRFASLRCSFAPSLKSECYTGLHGRLLYTRVTCRSFLRECLARVSQKSFLQEGPSGVVARCCKYKIVSHESRATVVWKSCKQVSSKSDPKAYTNVMQECCAGVSHSRMTDLAAECGGDCCSSLVIWLIDDM